MREPEILRIFDGETIFIGMKTREEIRNMSDEELDAYINRPNPHPINKEKEHLHFNTKEELVKLLF